MVLLLIYTSPSRNHLSLSFSLPLAPFPCSLAPLLPLPPSLASLPCYVLLFLAPFPCSLLLVPFQFAFGCLVIIGHVANISSPTLKTDVEMRSSLIFDSFCGVIILGLVTDGQPSLLYLSPLFSLLLLLFLMGNHQLLVDIWSNPSAHLCVTRDGLSSSP